MKAVLLAAILATTTQSLSSRPERSGVERSLYSTDLRVATERAQSSPSLSLSKVDEPVQPAATTWRFDNLTTIAGHKVTQLGYPAVIKTPLGKAVHFNGAATFGDALLIDDAPLAAATTYTFEVIFRPSSKGGFAQRFFHMQSAGSQSRRMFELRIVDNQWCLDAVAIDMPLTPRQPGFKSHYAIILSCDAAHMHPLDRWFAIAATYDGTTLRSYVNGELQGEIASPLTPLAPGATSVGTRIDHRDFFTGDILTARFTPRVLSPKEFLPNPAHP